MTPRALGFLSQMPGARVARSQWHGYRALEISHGSLTESLMRLKANEQKKTRPEPRIIGACVDVSRIRRAKGKGRLYSEYSERRTRIRWLTGWLKESTFEICRFMPSAREHAILAQLFIEASWFLVDVYIFGLGLKYLAKKKLQLFFHYFCELIWAPGTELLKIFFHFFLERVLRRVSCARRLKVLIERWQKWRHVESELGFDWWIIVFNVLSKSDNFLYIFLKFIILQDFSWWILLFFCDYSGLTITYSQEML